MKSQIFKTRLFHFSLATAAILLGACASFSSPASNSASDEGGLTGSELWARRCSACHNMRSPSTLTDAQWVAAMSHMRTRAKLNGKEARKILKFLQKSN